VLSETTPRPWGRALGSTAFFGSLALAGALLTAVAVRLWLAWRIPGPWVMVDELVYSELAKSIGTEAELLIRDEPTSFSSLLYPAAIAPAWLASSMTTAYVIAKVINVVAMTLAVVPLYLWARRLVSLTYALVAAGLGLLLPVFLYTGELMTENVAFPVFLLVAYVLALALERPTVVNQSLVLALIGAASLVRLQALVFLLVVPTAIGLNALLTLRNDETGAPRLRLLRSTLFRFWPTAAFFVAAGVAYLLYALVTGSRLAGGLGSYSPVTEADYSLAETARWFLYHLAELPLSVGFLPASALIVLLGVAAVRSAATSPAERAFLAVTTAAGFWFVLQAALFASQYSQRVLERSMLYVAPLLLIAFAVWLAQGLPRPLVPTALAAIAPPTLLFFVPFEDLLPNLAILADTLSLAALERLTDAVGGADRIKLLAVAAGLVSAVVFAALPRSWARVIAPALVAAFFLGITYAAYGPMRSYSEFLQRMAGTTEDAGWVDREVGADARVAYLYTPLIESEVRVETWVQLWMTEFWNRSIGPVYALGQREPGSLLETEFAIDPSTGELVTAGGAAARDDPEYALVDRRMNLRGEVVQERGPLVLYRIEPPLRVKELTIGVFPDTWVGAEGTYLVYGSPAAPGSQVEVILSRTAWGGTDVPGNVRIEVAEIRAGSGGLEAGPPTAVRTWVIHKLRERRFRIPVPAPSFRVRVTVEPTFSAADYGFPDTRQLGAQVIFRVVPAEEPGAA
jgi:hypothetical protein